MGTVSFMHTSLHNSMRHFAFLPVVAVVCALVCGSCEAGADSATFSILQGRVIKAEYRDNTFTVRSKLDCIRSLCPNRLKNCAVSYKSSNRHCMSAPVNGWLITWGPHVFTDTDPSWATYITKDSPPAVDRPAVLYLLDSVSRGTNLGSKGGQVNIIEAGLTDWSAQGPRGVHSHLKYLISGSSNRAEIPFKTSTGSYRIDFTGSYTVAAWVKTDTSVATVMPIIEGMPQDTLPDFWFYPSTKQDQLLLAPKYRVHYYKSAGNATGKQYWQHVAAVYKGFRDVQFYLNGSSFGQTIIGGDQNVMSLPEKLLLGNAPDINYYFYGAMACVTIHEKALSQAEVAALMTVCP